MANNLFKLEEAQLEVYSQSTSLLFQFALNEFIASYKKVLDIEELYAQMESALIKERMSADTDLYLEKLLKWIPVLAGSLNVTANEQCAPWTHQKGSLNKFRHYCYLLSHNLSDNSDILNLNVAASKAFHSTLQVREVVLSLQRQSEDSLALPNYVSLYQLLDRIIDNMRRASRLILRILLQFKEDENVLLFLLEHQKDLDVLYKTDFVTRIFKKMFPQGIEQVSQLMQQKYLERGFQSLSQSIAHQIEHLKSASASKVYAQ